MADVVARGGIGRLRVPRGAQWNKSSARALALVASVTSGYNTKSALVALLLGAAMVSNDKERAAAVDASDAAATDGTMRGVMDDLTPPG